MPSYSLSNCSNHTCVFYVSQTNAYHDMMLTERAVLTTITAAEPFDAFKQNAAHSPVPDVVTATVAGGWTWDEESKQNPHRALEAPHRNSVPSTSIVQLTIVQSIVVPNNRKFQNYRYYR
ncbi:hypothetical protein AVEN_41819-1 [Araneus ventricosus]|uniref:Uncharacterized protein n=1 Tax=Araneus ventricosus TaxID=182803 RepID=A0A4Y2ADW6_ARAVE|nr:hypothetical protein AVEN_41819-1 [Araneus ventricosus]